MKRMRVGMMTVHVAGCIFLMALLVLPGMPAVQAGLIDLGLTGELEDGGSFAGRFRYDEDAPDREPSPLLDLFALERWTINVTLGSGEEFLFESAVPNPARGVIGIDPSPAQVFLHFSDPAGEIDPTRPTLQVVFEYLGPVPLTGTPPTRRHWGRFDPLLSGEFGIRSFFGRSVPGQPGPTEFVFVTEASIPAPAVPALLFVGLVGLGVARVRRRRA